MEVALHRRSHPHSFSDETDLMLLVGDFVVITGNVTGVEQWCKFKYFPPFGQAPSTVLL